MDVRRKEKFSFFCTPIFCSGILLFSIFTFFTERSHAQEPGSATAARIESIMAISSHQLRQYSTSSWVAVAGPPIFQEEAFATDWSGSEAARSFDSPSVEQANSQLPQNPESEKEKKTTPPAGNSSTHMYWVVPAYKVDFNGHFEPLTPNEKFKEWAQGVYDPLGLGVTAFEAGTIEYSSTDGFCGYGHGWGPYGQCYGSLEADATISSFIGDYALAVWWHQDPRYFRLGKGPIGKRVLYAISRVFIAYNDSGHNVFSSASLTGTAAAAAISNLYYPQQDRGVSSSISRAGLDLGNTAIYNTSAEFWPDIHRWVRRTF